MISALFANSNWDGDNAQARADHIKELNRHFNDAIQLVYFPEGVQEDIDWNNPFFAAHKRSLQKARIKFGLDEDPKAAEAIELLTESDKEQLQARLDSRKAIDQM
jgi:hypothetical protein